MKKEKYVYVGFLILSLLLFPISVFGLQSLSYGELSDLAITTSDDQLKPISFVNCNDVITALDYLEFVVQRLERNDLIKAKLAEVAREQKLEEDEGKILIGINYDGSSRYLRIVEPFVNEEFGQNLLSSLEKHIFPLCPFTSEMRKEMDVLEIVRTVRWQSN